MISTYYFPEQESQAPHAEYAAFCCLTSIASNPETVQNSDDENPAQRRSFDRVAACSRAEGPVRAYDPSSLSDLDAFIDTLPDSTFAYTPPKPVTRQPSLIERLTAKTEEKAKEKSSARRLLASCSWAYLSRDQRHKVEFDYAASKIGGVAFSLNFSAKRLASLKKSKTPKRDLYLALNRAMKKHFGRLLPMAFFFEFTRSGRLHVHGVAILPDFLDETQKLFRRVLKTSGGKIEGLGSGRQCDVRGLHDAAGWHGYCSKDAKRTRDTLGTDDIVYVSADLRAEAQADHNARHAKTKKTTAKVKPEPVAEKAKETHTESPKPSPACGRPKTPEDSPRASMAVSAKGALPASLIDDIEDLLDGL
jgi:hypothetical protein